MNKATRGRKKLSADLKKVPITIYTEQHKIDCLGGMVAIRDYLLESINTKCNE